MKTFLLVVMSVIVSVNAYANSNWVYLTTSNDDNVFFIDNNSIQKSGDSKTYWRRDNFGKRDEQGDLSAKGQITINCRTREIILRYIMKYDDINNNGKLTRSFTPKDTWTPIAPDSVNWSFLEYVCK